MDINLGDKVRVKPTYRYAADWPGEYLVIGLRLLPRIGPRDRIDVTITATGNVRYGEWDGPTDGFSADELEVMPVQMHGRDAEVTIESVQKDLSLMKAVNT